jgi:hypothetical protein
MADYTRHGDGSHFMRPDRVYRTSVLSPMVGYQPQADVQHVAMAFTQGPARGMTLEGLGAMPGPIQRFFARLKARIAQRKAQKLMQVVGPQGQSPVPQPPPFVPTSRLPQPSGMGQGMPGPAPMMGDQIAPHLAAQMMGVVQIAQLRYGTGYPGVAAEALVMRPIGQWYC